MLIVSLVIIWFTTILIGARLGGALADRDRGGSKWVLPPPTFAELLHRRQQDPLVSRLVPIYLVGIVLSGALFILVVARVNG